MDRSLLARATDGSDAPTPGYLYLDIAKNASTSPNACSEIATYLSRRLQSKNNHNVKFKCLKVIAKVAESPVTRGQFKRAMSQDPSAVAAIKEALQFRGPPDPARGDEVNARVRTAAKEALDAIYSDTPSSSEYSGGGGGRGISSSYSPSPYAGGGAPSSSGGPGRMQGIGNPMYADPRLQVEKGIGNMTIGEVAHVVAETVVDMVKDPLARNVDVGPPRNSSMPGYGSGGAYSNPPPGQRQLTQQTGGEWTMASNRGPSAVVPPQNYNSERDEAYFKARDSGSTAFQWAQQQNAGGQTAGSRMPGGVGGTWGSAPATGGTSMPSVASQARQPAFGAPVPPTHHAPPTGTGGRAASDGSYERTLILELCPPGGMKPEPPPDKLASFARAVPSLDSDLVCPVLLDCLEDGQPWVIRAKALCVIDTVLRVAEENQQDGGTNAYADFFFTCRGEIEPLASHPRLAIKEPAKRVLRALGLEAESRAGAPPSKTGFKPPRPAPQAAEPPNLLDFMDESAPAPSPTPAAATPTQPSSDSLFGGLQTKDAPSAPPSVPPPPPPTPTTSETFLGEMTPASSPAPAPSGGNLFGDMKVKETPALVTATDAAPPANGSAFGFINSSPPPAPPQSSEPAPPAASFDPLLSLGNVSPSTAKAILTPAQMQQMAYQQMMMQQQMQMAYAMQQQQMGRPLMPAGTMIHQAGSSRNIMKNNAGAAASSPFSFMDAPTPKKDDHTFDFVMDAMKDEGTKK